MDTRYDTLQEVGDYASANDQTHGKIEDGVTKIYGGNKTRAVMRPIDEARTRFIEAGNALARVYEAAKAEYVQDID